MMVTRNKMMRKKMRRKTKRRKMSGMMVVVVKNKHRPVIAIEKNLLHGMNQIQEIKNPDKECLEIF